MINLPREISSLKREYFLSELMGCKYTRPEYQNDLEEFFSLCERYYKEKNIKIIIDISGCKIVKGIAHLFTKYADSILFTDGSNPFVNDILIHNSEVKGINKLIQEGKLVVETIPSISDPAALYDYLENINTTTMYRIPSFRESNGQSMQLNILTAMAVMCHYPEVKIDICDQAESFFVMFNTMWSYSGQVHRKMYHILWNSIPLLVVADEKQDALGNNLFYVAGIGTMTEDVLNKTFKCIPYEFGSTDDFSKDIELEGLYDRICDKISIELTKKRNQQIRKKRRLIDELKRK